MTCILVIGDKDDSAMEHLIKTTLSDSYQITYIKDNSVTRVGKGYEILVIDTEFICNLELSECIVVMKADGVVPAPTLPEMGIIIANSENTEQLSMLKDAKQHVVTCGNNKRDTLSYTSLTNDGIVISLNRELTAFSGKKIQPLEIPARFSNEPEKTYDYIAFTALRLILDDFNSEIGLLY